MATVEEGTLKIKQSSNQNGANRGNRSRAPQDGTSRSNRSTASANDRNKNQATVNQTALPVDVEIVDEHEEEEAEGSDLCHICSSHITIKAFYHCSHSLCHRCSLRRRALANDKNCLFCRTECPQIIMSSKTEREFDSFSSSELVYEDLQHGIQFEDEKTKEKVLRLLKLTCPVKSCPENNVEYVKWKDVKRHVKEVHGKRYCDLCLRHLQAFPYEQHIYTPKQLRLHDQEGDKARGFSGHPKCQFCDDRYYTNDELMAHCIKDHEKCFICERIDPTQAPNFFLNYQALDEHFINQHYACQISSCIEKKFVVFRFKEELQHHMLDEHKDIIGKQKSALVIDTETSLRRNNRFASELSTIPSTGLSSASNPSSRYGSSSNLPNLNSAEAFPELGARRNNAPAQTIRQPGNVSSFHSSMPTQDETINSISRRFNERAKILLQQTPGKLESLDRVNKKYAKDRDLSEDDLIRNYEEIFTEADDEQLEILVTEFAKTLRVSNTQKGKKLEEIASKRFAGVHQPSLLSSLRTKVAGTNGTWKGTKIHDGDLKSETNFPSLPTASTSRQLTALPSRPVPQTYSSSPSITTAALTSAPRTSTATRVPTPSVPSSVSKKLAEDSFPALPSRQSNYKPIKGKLTVASNSAWGPQSGSASPTVPSGTDLPSLDDAVDRNRKKGKKKQVLYQFNAYS